MTLNALRWRPSSLQDVSDLPYRVLPLFLAYSNGLAKRDATATPKATGVFAQPVTEVPDV